MVKYIGAIIALLLGLFFFVAAMYTFVLDLSTTRQMLVGGIEFFLAIFFIALFRYLKK